jgi:type IV pilus assembly protein PilW
MKKNTGFSLIELLIGMAIALLALIALSEIYLTTKQTNRIQLMQSRISEDGKFAISVIQRSLQQAGYRQSSSTSIPDDRISGTSSSITLKFESDGTNQMDCDVASAASGSHTQVISLNSNALECALDGGTPSVWLSGASAGTGSSSDVVSLNFQYGIDTGPATNANFGCGVASGLDELTGDCIADTYVSTIPDLALGYTSNQVVSTRVCLILKSEQKDSSIIKSSAVKDCQGNDIADSQNDRHLYRKFSTTVVLRNR